MDVTPLERRVRTSRAERALQRVRDRLDSTDAVAFVHAGTDADGAVFGSEAVVVTPERAVSLVDDDRPGEPPRDDRLAVRTVHDPASAVARVVGEVAETGTVLAPRGIRYDAALFLERAGFEVASTTALAEARSVKTAAEGEALSHVGAATTAGVEATVDLLAGASVAADGTLRVDTGDDDGGTRRETGDGTDDADPLTATRLRRRVAVTLARAGVDAGETRVYGAGPSEGALVRDRPIMVDCRPRGPVGTRVRATWTLVVDGDGGWERRAHVALRAAHGSARGRLAAALDGETETAGSVVTELRAELAAYGFEDPSVAVHGVGLAERERPRGDDTIEPGQAVVVAATVTRAADGTVGEERRADAVTWVETYLLDDGVERLVSLPESVSVAAAHRAVER
ncbi:Xaa-Pro aminopeptidase [Salinigranum salinum]|uniref:Xaa-Pro aminopeptidase n=1 Tax=Salinigranum salinum TaxID=1364937 RepID=UPI0012606DCF|nr:Xaa-Pro aminopeptidase [Salinigranum salinum]